MVGIHVQVDMYRERGGGDIIWGIHGEYPFAGGDVQSSMILDGNKKPPMIILSCINFVSV
jgi:hypothetical protein